MGRNWEGKRGDGRVGGTRIPNKSTIDWMIGSKRGKWYFVVRSAPSPPPFRMYGFLKALLNRSVRWDGGTLKIYRAFARTECDVA